VGVSVGCSVVGASVGVNVCIGVAGALVSGATYAFVIHPPALTLSGTHWSQSPLASSQSYASFTWITPYPYWSLQDPFLSGFNAVSAKASRICHWEQVGK
jgi:hypothetical protein